MVKNEDQLRLKLDYTYMLADNIGPEHGVIKEELEDLQPQIAKAVDDLHRRREQGELPFLELPYQEQVVREVRALADQVSQRFDTLVVVGIGGSALGPQALYQALGSGYQAGLGQKTQRPLLIFCDNVDPEELHRLLEGLDLERTAST